MRQFSCDHIIIVSPASLENVKCRRGLVGGAHLMQRADLVCVCVRLAANYERHNGEHSPADNKQFAGAVPRAHLVHIFPISSLSSSAHCLVRPGAQNVHPQLLYLLLICVRIIRTDARENPRRQDEEIKNCARRSPPLLCLPLVYFAVRCEVSNRPNTRNI